MNSGYLTDSVTPRTLVITMEIFGETEGLQSNPGPFETLKDLHQINIDPRVGAH